MIRMSIGLVMFECDITGPNKEAVHVPSEDVR